MQQSMSQERLGLLLAALLVVLLILAGPLLAPAKPLKGSVPQGLPTARVLSTPATTQE